MEKKYRVRNWRDYNEALVKRGSITFWFDEEAIKAWQSGGDRSGKRGRPQKYPDGVIACSLTLRAIYKLPFRATEGFIRDLSKLLGLHADVPDYTLLCKRQKDLELPNLQSRLQRGEDVVILVDSTGLKVAGDGEWKVRQHGSDRRRTWKKLHIGVNSQTHEIEAVELTEPGIQDCQAFPEVIGKVKGKIKEVIGDGAYDRFSCYEVAEKRNCRLIAPPQHNARTSREKWDNRKKASPEAVKKRDETVLEVREKGSADWKAQTGYHRRSLAETAMFRVKTLLGNRLRSRKEHYQKTEVAVWCNALNKMLALGMPNTVAVN